MKEQSKNKVIIGMSGGVDSSVAAKLLQKKGYEVIGVYLDFWKDIVGKNNGYEDAKKVASILGIELHKVDARNEFKREVVNYFLREFQEGRTPNPCVICNPTMKFKILLEASEEFSCDFVATGHYAQIKDGKLFQGVDKSKDQSYFLYGLTKRQLQKIMFPLGKYTKDEVREIAYEEKLPVAEKPESQDICFIRNGDFRGFLEEHLEIEDGDIIDSEGNILGRHAGLPFYTIGQRRGINLGGNGPYYVAGKDSDKNRIIVTNEKDSEMLYEKDMIVSNVNWISDDIEFPLEMYIKIRYRTSAIKATISPVENSTHFFKVEFSKPQKAVTPGQSAVFYGKNEAVIGGGIIN
ncbi:tRNA 2-thiouridine(34) synthase MnmA [Patescibacteria group bacterium]